MSEIFLHSIVMLIAPLCMKASNRQRPLFKKINKLKTKKKKILPIHAVVNVMHFPCR